MSRNFGFMDLNQDCINHLCLFLCTRDKLSLAIVCDKVIVRKLNWHHVMKHFNSDQIEIILSRIGKNLRSVNYTVFDPLAVESNLNKVHGLMQQFCPHHVQQHIKSPSLQNYWMFEHDSRLISSLKHEENLYLYSMRDVNGDYLYRFRNLSELHFANCPTFTSANFEKICQANKFKVLSIQNCEGIGGTAIQTIFSTQTELEEFSIQSNANVRIHDCQLKKLQILNVKGQVCLKILTQIARREIDCLKTLFIDGQHSRHITEIRNEIFKLKNLQKLGILSVLYPEYGNSYPNLELVDEEFITELGLYCTNLKELILPNCRNQTISCVLTIVGKFPNLNFLDLSGFQLLYDTLFRDIGKVLKMKKPSQPLKIYARFTDVPKKFMKTKLYQDSMDVLTLTFDDEDGCKEDKWSSILRLLNLFSYV